MTMPAPLLDIAGLTVAFRSEQGEREVVSDLSFAVGEGEIVGVVGESGSGKTVLSRSIMGLLPASSEGLMIRGLKAEATALGQWRFQMLVMQSGKAPAEFSGRYEVWPTGQLGGKAWSAAAPVVKEIQLRQYARAEGVLDVPPDAVIKSIQVKVLDARGAIRATHTARF